MLGSGFLAFAVQTDPPWWHITAILFGALVVVGTKPFGLDDPTSIETTVGVIAIALTVAVLCFLKGKLFSGVVSLFMPVLGAPAAVRVARPTSPWARWFYVGPRQARLDKARRRFDPDRREARVGRHLQDLVAGAPNDR